MDLFKEIGKLGCQSASTLLEKNWKHKIFEDDPLVNKGGYHLLGLTLPIVLVLSVSSFMLLQKDTKLLLIKFLGF